MKEQSVVCLSEQNACTEHTTKEIGGMAAAIAKVVLQLAAEGGRRGRDCRCVRDGTSTGTTGSDEKRSSPLDQERHRHERRSRFDDRNLMTLIQDAPQARPYPFGRGPRRILESRRCP